MQALSQACTGASACGPVWVLPCGYSNGQRQWQPRFWNPAKLADRLTHRKLNTEQNGRSMRTWAASGSSRTNADANSVDPVLSTVSQLASQALSSGALSSLIGGVSSSSRQQQQQQSTSKAYYLVGAITLLFLLGTSVKTSGTPLILNHARPLWWQFLTSGWLIESWRHLAQTAFFVCVFGKAVERLEGTWAMAACFVASCVGGALASFALLPHKVSIMSGGPEAGVFGLACMATVFSRLPWSWPRVLELLCIGPFVLITIATTDMALAPLVTWNRVRVGHLVPLLGGMLGSALVAGGCLLVRKVLARSRPQSSPAAAEGLVDPVASAIGRMAGFILKKVL